MKKTRVDEVLNRLERMGLDQIIITDANLSDRHLGGRRGAPGGLIPEPA